MMHSFGLGQHQSDECNWKGQNEELYQYNTKISIHFIISSKVTAYFGAVVPSADGGPSPYEDHGEDFNLRDDAGTEGGLTGLYVPKEGKNMPATRRCSSGASRSWR